MKTALSVRVTPEQAAWLESQIGGFRKIADVVRDCIDAQRLQTPKALDTPATLGAPPPGGLPSTLTSRELLSTSRTREDIELCSKLPQGSDATGKRRRSTGTRARGEYPWAFAAFWRQYLAIDRRASGQSKPKAFEAWSKVVPKLASADALQACLLAAIQDQRRIERQGGFATPFPDAFRWLRDGRWESFLVSGASDAPEAPSRPAQGPLSDDPF